MTDLEVIEKQAKRNREDRERLKEILNGFLDEWKDVTMGMASKDLKLTKVTAFSEPKITNPYDGVEVYLKTGSNFFYTIVGNYVANLQTVKKTGLDKFSDENLIRIVENLEDAIEKFDEGAKELNEKFEIYFG